MVGIWAEEIQIGGLDGPDFQMTSSKQGWCINAETQALLKSQMSFNMYVNGQAVTQKAPKRAGSG